MSDLDVDLRLHYRGDQSYADYLQQLTTPSEMRALAADVATTARTSGQFALAATAGMRMRTRRYGGQYQASRHWCSLVQVSIADPAGRVAAWIDLVRLPIMHLTLYGAAKGVLPDPRVAVYWHGQLNRGGRRDTTAIALAAARVLHARAFGEVPAERDVLLAEFANHVVRPATPTLLAASIESLAAASALCQAGQVAAATELIKRTTPRHKVRKASMKQLALGDL